MKTLCKFIGLPLTASLIAACGSESAIKTANTEISNETAMTNKEMHREYVKPGASVTMTHNFKGFVQPGNSGNVNVTFTPSANAGTMTVNTTTKGGLELSKTTSQQAFKLGTASDYAMNVDFSTQAPGLQYINFQVTTTDAAGQTLGRAFSVPIQVGDPALNPPSKPAVNIETTSSGQRIVVMDAEETITRSE